MSTPVKTDETFLQQLQSRLSERIAKRAQLKTEMDAVLEVPTAEKRDLNEAEAAKFTELRSAIAQLDGTDPESPQYGESIAALQQRVTELTEVEQRRYEVAKTTPSAEVRVKKEERIYGPAAERRGVSFLRDVMNAQTRGDFSAAQRLERHMAEERVERAEFIEGIEQRDVGTGAFAGLTVPQYLTDLVAPTTRAMRPFADICRSHDLPDDGMTVNISRITTASATAVQATENAATQETNMDDTLLTVDVRTIAGQQDVSRQAIDRGTGIDSIVVADLVGAYHTTLDSGILNDDGTSGTHLGVRNVTGNVAVTYTDATPTAAELFPKLADLVQQIQAATNEGVTHFVMHPRRWWWLATNLSSTFPLLTINNAGSRQAGSVGDTSYAAAGASILGATVVLDRNIPTTLGAGTEDAIIGVDANECHLWEDSNAPLLIRAEQTGAGNLTVKFVVYGYSAFTAGRYPLATGDITGTGLIAPTF